MLVTAIKTRPLTPPQDDLYGVLDHHLTDLQDGDILCITSKVLAIHEGRTEKIVTGEREEKDALTAREADMSLPRDFAPHGHVKHTITQGNLASSAGIDASNGNGHYILWPENSSQSAKEISSYLKKKHGITKLGIIITDSRSTPLRYGASGYAIGSFGVQPLVSIVGEKDIFKSDFVFKCEQINVIDSLACAATLEMGEGSECTPLCIIRDAHNVIFDENADFDTIKVPFKEDMYYPFLKRFEEKL